MSNGDEKNGRFKGGGDINISGNRTGNSPKNGSAGSRDVYSDSSRERSAKAVYSDGVYISKSVNAKKGSGKDIYFSENSRRYDTDEFIIDVSPKGYSKKEGEPVRRSGSVRVYDEEPRDVYSEKRTTAKKPKKKKHTGAKIFAGVTALLLAAVVLFGAVGVSSVKSAVNSLVPADEIEHIENESLLVCEEGVTNVLLIGADKEKYGTQRSDAIIIASVNKNTGKITLTSVLRDCYVYIPDEGYAKINASFAWGGANLLIQTIETNFGIKIDDYAVVDFDMFTALIDGLGGIDIEVTEAEAEFLNNGQDYKSYKKPDEFTSGESVHLNGYQALWYARIRYLDSDFMRTSRQRKVISSVIKSAKSKLTPTGIFELMKTAKTVAPYVKTTLTQDELLSLGLDVVSCLSNSEDGIENTVISQKIPFDGTWYYDTIYGEDVVVIDEEENKDMLYSSVYRGVDVDNTDEE